jgi:tetratricopeptide (TPR) repeat protein
LAGAGWNVWFYLYKALLPFNLIFVYPKWEIDPHAALSYLPGVAYLVVLAALWFFRKTWGRPFFFALAFYVVMLFPILGFFKIFFFRYSLVADHYQYYSLLAVIALVVALVTRFFPKEGAFVFIGLAIGCAILTIRQCGIYKNQEVLWTDTLKKNPRCWMAHGNWAYYYQEMAEGADRGGQGGQAAALYGRAIDQYHSALVIKPDDVGSIFNTGVCLMRLRRIEEAVVKFREVIHLNPIHVDSLDALGFYLATTDNPSLRNGAEAISYAKRAVALTQGKDDMKLESLAAAYAANGQFPEAAAAQQKAIDAATRAGKTRDLPDMTEQLKSYQQRRPRIHSDNPK